jgi:hypothetical protein
VVVEPRATQKIEDSVAQEFEALVVFDRFRVLIDVGAVRQSAGQDEFVFEGKSQTLEKRAGGFLCFVIGQHG